MCVLQDEAWLAPAARSRRGAMAAWQEEQEWKEPKFPSWRVSGLLFLGVCGTGTGYGSQAGKGGDRVLLAVPQ